MSGSRVSYKLSEFAKSLPEDEFKFYCEKIEELAYLGLEYLGFWAEYLKIFTRFEEMGYPIISKQFDYF